MNARHLKTVELSIPPEVQAFREQHRKTIPNWYNSKVHFIATTCVSLPLSAYALFKLGHLTFLEWLMIPTSFVFASLVEYLTHRYPLHRKIWPLTHGYVEHTVRHHAFFTHDAIEFELSRDFYQVLFPIWGVALIQYGVGLPFSLLVGAMVGANAGYLALIVGSLFFFFYETIHMICHLRPEHWIFKIPGLSLLREHHRIHHHKSRMGKYNFNVVFPMWDKILGTSIKE